MRRHRHMALTENCPRCSATNAYLALHPWRNTRSPLSLDRWRTGLALFWNVPLFRHARQLAHQPTDLDILIGLACGRLRDLALPRIERRQSDPKPLRNLLDRVAPLRDLCDRVTLELVCEIDCAHHGILASKLAKKASRKHGAIQITLAATVICWSGIQTISACGLSAGPQDP